MHRTITTLIGIITLLAVAGCGTTSGTKMESSKVSQIKKGVTTRAELEQLLGPPANVSMMGDGRRMLFYRFSDTQQKTGSKLLFASGFIPFAGMATGAASVVAAGAGAATSGSKTRMQMLQVILSKDGIVEDYEFSDKTMDVSTSPLGAKITTGETEKK